MTSPARSLQQHEAVARRALLDVDVLRRAPRPRRRRRDLRVADHDPFRRAAAAARSSTSSRSAVRSITLDGRPLDPDLLDRGRLPLETDAGAARARRRRGDALPQRRRGPAPQRRPGRRAPLRLRHVVHGRRAHDLRLLRPARPQGALHLPRPRTARLDRDRQRARPPRSSPACGSSSTTPAAVDVLRHARRRALPRAARRARRHPARAERPRRAWPPHLDARRRRAVHDDPAVLRRVPPAVRHPLPLRRLPPGVRAGVQRRRHGEPRLRDLPRPARLRQPGHPRRADRAGDDRRPRDGAPVVRQHRDPAVVGRPVAQRVVRRVPRQPGHRRRHRVRRRLDRTTPTSRRQWGLVADQRPSTHPVAGNGAVDAVAALQDFDGISYAKGSSDPQAAQRLARRRGVLRRRRSTTSTATASATRRCTTSSPAGSAPAAGDLVRRSPPAGCAPPGPTRISLDRAAGVAATYAAGRAPRRPRAHASTSAAPATAARGAPRRSTLAGPTTALDAVGTQPVVLDPYEETWAALVPDATTVAGLAVHLAGVTDPALRAAAWNNLRSGYHLALPRPGRRRRRRGGQPAGRGLRRHRSPRAALAALAGAAVSHRRGRSSACTTAFVSRLRTATPASEQQLAALRGSIRTATSSDLLRGWLDGSGLPAGVDLDLDLRWRVLGRLATLGATDARRARRRAGRRAHHRGHAWSTRGPRASLPDGRGEGLGLGAVHRGRRRAQLRARGRRARAVARRPGRA